MKLGSLAFSSAALLNKFFSSFFCVSPKLNKRFEQATVCMDRVVAVT